MITLATKKAAFGQLFHISTPIFSRIGRNALKSYRAYMNTPSKEYVSLMKKVQAT